MLTKCALQWTFSMGWVPGGYSRLRSNIHSNTCKKATVTVCHFVKHNKPSYIRGQLQITASNVDNVNLYINSDTGICLKPPDSHMIMQLQLWGCHLLEDELTVESIPYTCPSYIYSSGKTQSTKPNGQTFWLT